MRAVWSLVASAALALLTSCASDMRHEQMDSMLAKQTPETSLPWLAEQSAAHPDDLALRSRYLQVRRDVVNEHLRKAVAAYEAGDPVQAREWVGKAIAIAPDEQPPRAMMEWIDRQAQIDSKLKYAESVMTQRPQEALAIASEVLSRQPGNLQAGRLRDALQAPDGGKSGPVLTRDLDRPITVQFRDQPLISIFELMSNITGLNFTFDREVVSTAPTTIYATNTPIKQVLSLVLQSNQLASKVVSGNALLIYPRRPDKEMEYRDLTVRTFYLQNAQAPQVLAALKQMVKTRDVVLDERTNAIIMRDSEEAIGVAERLIAAMDVTPAEVVLEAEVLEVSATDLLQFGLLYPDRIEFTASPAAGSDIPGRNTPGLLTLEELRSLNSGDILVRLGAPSLALDMLQREGRTNTLANPRIRVRNREKAKVLIGDRLPVVTTTLSDNFSTESINYQDVGLSLEAEPIISSNDEVQVKLRLEVSSVTDTITTSTGLVAYQIGTRTAETVMSVRNNQTQALAGLLQRNEQAGGTGIPGLSRIPILDRIFGTRGSDKRRTELILLLTPHIVRNQGVPVDSITDFYSGTETHLVTQRDGAAATAPAPATMQGGATPSPGQKGAAAAPPPGATPAAQSPPPSPPPSPPQGRRR
ncbi:secretin N-terminal domain-containing protein [Lysobacter sp. GCM10012299]|uniref:secretin N-terminal domain-containing protein n=1 Tax=Lysobacter sp. GCM10012299 TaxID=3317333 RepID=UPI00361A9A12